MIYECKKCGAKHGLGLEDTSTAKIIPIDFCRECIFGEQIVPSSSQHVGGIEISLNPTIIQQLWDEVKSLKERVRKLEDEK